MGHAIHGRLQGTARIGQTHLAHAAVAGVGGFLHIAGIGQLAHEGRHRGWILPDGFSQSSHGHRVVGEQLHEDVAVGGHDAGEPFAGHELHQVTIGRAERAAHKADDVAVRGHVRDVLDARGV